MPVYWSPSSKTALAESELEYNSQHVSKACYVKLKVTAASAKIVLTATEDKPLFLLIWTTTPWSLPANKAVCFKPGSQYVAVKLQTGSLCIVANEALQSNSVLQEALGQYEIVCEVSQDQLSQLTYHQPIMREEVMPVLPGEHVTLDAGTGLVHTAPAHGQEDHQIGLEHSLDLSCPVDQNGKFTKDAGSMLVGLDALTSGSEKVLSILDEDLLKVSDYVHSYPYDWRTKMPVLLRASKQWFVDVGQLRSKAAEALTSVGIRPESARAGFEASLERRPYWCISRQRAWGVPIPAVYEEDGRARMEAERFCKLVDQHGPDFRWILDSNKVTGDPLTTMDTDVMDVWMDSGLTWQSLKEDKKGERRADLYLEGSDQFSGWFYSSLVTSVALQDCAPYNGLFVHGFTVEW